MPLKLDINECSTNNGGCDSNAICTNIQGGFECECKDGYLGDGIICNPAEKDESNQVIGIGIGVGVGVLALCLLVLFILFFLRKNVLFFFFSFLFFFFFSLGVLFNLFLFNFNFFFFSYKFLINK